MCFYCSFWDQVTDTQKVIYLHWKIIQNCLGSSLQFETEISIELTCRVTPTTLAAVAYIWRNVHLQEVEKKQVTKFEKISLVTTSI